MRVDLVYAALADAVTAAAIPRLTAHAFVPDSVAVPAFFPADCSGAYDQTFGGMLDLEITCRVLVARADDASGHALLQRLLSPAGDHSVKRAIEASRGTDQVLGGACDDVHVRRWQGYRYYVHNGTTYLGAELITRVIGDPEE